MARNGENESKKSGLRGTLERRNTTPEYRTSPFRCPRCGDIAQQEWIDLYEQVNLFTEIGATFSGHTKLNDLAMSECASCSGRSLWFEERLVYPVVNSLEPMPEDLPSNLRRDFEEARAIAPNSPRAAAALMRMCVEQLCKALAEEDRFDDAIAKLEKNGLPDQISKALDIVRLNGNQVLHAGRLYGEDDAKTVEVLFRLVRAIVHWAITEKRELEELYSAIPQAKRDHAEKRRAKSKDGGGD